MTVHLPEMSVRLRRTQAILKYQLTSTRHEHRRLFQQFNTHAAYSTWRCDDNTQPISYIIFTSTFGFVLAVCSKCSSSNIEYEILD